MLDFSVSSLIELKDFLHILSSYHLFRKAAWSLVSMLDTTPYMVMCSQSKYDRADLPQLMARKALQVIEQSSRRLIGHDAKMKTEQSQQTREMPGTNRNWNHYKHESQT